MPIVQIGLTTTRATRQYPAVFDPCRVCGRGPLHRLGCPVLTRVTFMAGAFFAVLSVVLAALRIAGGPSGNVALSLGLTAFFSIYWAASRSKATP